MSGSICAVYNCYSYTVLNCSKSFFRFPKDQNICQKWVHECRRYDLDKIFKKHGPKRLYQNYRICSDHFAITNFRNPKLASQGLLPGSVPSKNLPSSLKKRLKGDGSTTMYDNAAVAGNEMEGLLRDARVSKRLREDPALEIKKLKKQMQQQQKKVSRMCQQMQEMRREMLQLKQRCDSNKDSNVLEAGDELTPFLLSQLKLKRKHL